MSSITHSLAAQFAIELQRRKSDRLVHHSRLMSIIAIMLLIGASFIPEPALRRTVGLPILGLLLTLKGFVSYRDWKAKTAPSDLNASERHPF